MEPFDEQLSLAARTTMALLAILCAFAALAAVLYPGLAAVFWVTEHSYGYAVECLAIAAVAPVSAGVGLHRARRREDSRAQRRRSGATWFAVTGLVVGSGWILASVLATGI